MDIEVFAIVDVDNDERVVTWGMTIGKDSVTFERDPNGFGHSFGVFESPERALLLEQRLGGHDGELELRRYLLAPG